MAIRFERQEDRRLDGIGVLILIHQHVVEQAAHLAREFGHLHQFRPIEKKIVIVENMLALLRLDIGLEQAAKILLEAGAPGEMLREHAVEGVAGIHRPRIDGKAGGLQRKALLLLGEPQLMADEVQEIGGILPVVNGEGGVEADGMREVAQEPRADGVKGAGPADGRPAPGSCRGR